MQRKPYYKSKHTHFKLNDYLQSKVFFFYEELFFFVHRLDRVNYRIKNKKNRIKTKLPI